MHADTAYVQILSATVRDLKIDDAVVILQRNGQPSLTSRTDSAGRAPLPTTIVDDSSALVIVRKQGYSDLVARCPCGGLTYALSPTLSQLDGMRIVLNWSDHPSDLDGHLGFSAHHISFQNKHEADTQLDVDHTDGYGPETITIAQRHAGERYVYAVQDYSDKMFSGSSELSQSDAKVFVYVGQTLIRTYYVPKNRTGNLWTVFAVSETGELQNIDTMSDIHASTSADLTYDAVFGLQQKSDPATPSQSGPIAERARKLNTEGETAYRQGDLERAIQLFQQALEQQDDYGQAYSNLGLTFQKAGRVAEALWANRKAIALAGGPNAATVRASTHFNNGRIYETAGQWDNALREYESAVREKDSSVYENAIQRVRQQGAGK
jgi:uncharacterized protein YfaP (DUF2135 family)